MVYKEVYADGCLQLEKNQIENAKLDARLLLEFVCHTNRNDLFAHGDREVAKEERTAYEKLLKRRISHEPLQYIIGTQEFMGLTFEVNEHVLIPRQDTEILVEEAMLRLYDGMRILDMCTGSGCILLSLLHYSNDCAGVGVDISKEALLVADRNAKRTGETATFIRSDLFTELSENEKFDILVSNPPYIETAVIAELMPEVREHEPMAALDGMEDGFFFYRKILNECGNYLNGGATVLFEIGCNQGEQVKRLMQEQGFCEVAISKDLAGLDRVVSGTFIR